LIPIGDAALGIAPVQQEGSSMENGFKTMSEAADEGRDGTASSQSSVEAASDRLKDYGVDTNVMADAAADRVSELQRLIIEEVRERPLRALGWAAAVGVVFGFWAAK